MNQTFKGKTLSKKIYDEIRGKLSEVSVSPRLDIILASPDKGSSVYTKLKKEKCKELGFDCRLHEFSSRVRQIEIKKSIEKLNDNEKVDGVLVQLPLYNHLDRYKVLEVINSGKDVDGLTSKNRGGLLEGVENFSPCMPQAVFEILNFKDIRVEGKHVVIINHSSLVGKPLAIMFMNRGATVTVCHKKTSHLREHTKRADILVSSTGKPNLVNEGMVKEGSVVLDTGFSLQGDKIMGDVNFDEIKKGLELKVPVPGGVGPVTVAVLMRRLFLMAKSSS
ncbi:MAG: bifunctional 5,10-methylenetetrahydrofolate dehydrogenase/5,10-methenyltetrahydrofolate cyclohydrolase [Candidatus Magasanikbacteria bacterium]